jgi:hypothetical protein
MSGASFDGPPEKKYKLALFYLSGTSPNMSISLLTSSDEFVVNEPCSKKRIGGLLQGLTNVTAGRYAACVA